MIKRLQWLQRLILIQLFLPPVTGVREQYNILTHTALSYKQLHSFNLVYSLPPQLTNHPLSFYLSLAFLFRLFLSLILSLSLYISFCHPPPFLFDLV